MPFYVVKYRQMVEELAEYTVNADTPEEALATAQEALANDMDLDWRDGDNSTAPEPYRVTTLDGTTAIAEEDMAAALAETT